MKSKAPLAAILSLLALNFANAPASAFTMTFDESGNCSSTVGTCSSVLAPDPTGKVTGNVLIFTLPSLVASGNANIFDPDGVTLSDHLRWIDANNSDTACPEGTTPCANRMIFYSLDDLGGQTPIFTTPNFTNENANGSFVWHPPGGVNIYDGVSNVPLPAALPLFASGLAGLGLLGWRRKKAAAG
jgi:hypothetical protein